MRICGVFVANLSTVAAWKVVWTQGFKVGAIVVHYSQTSEAIRQCLATVKALYPKDYYPYTQYKQIEDILNEADAKVQNELEEMSREFHHI